jgi:hypothetical protein
MSPQDACIIADTDYDSVKDDPVFRNEVEKATHHYEHYLLGQLKACISDQVDGGKANSSAVIWALEHIFPERYGKDKNSVSDAMPIHIHIDGAVDDGDAVECLMPAEPVRVEMSGDEIG